MENSSNLAVCLREAAWFAFDLDDTLHSFRKASAAAVTAVLRHLLEVSEAVYSLEDLNEEYKRILANRTASAFVDGKTSHEYREDRFQRLTRDCNIELPEGQMQSLLNLYEGVLQKSLELKAGVLDLFRTLKRHGHKIAVITEGPQDAQERTVEALGLTSYIDYLATTNRLGVAKVDGMFVKVLQHLDLRAKDMIMIGDSWDRDIVPATQAGMQCVHYAEQRPESLGPGGQISIKSFQTFRTLIESAHCPV